MFALPTGTITFLFTDIQGSTKLWDAHPDAMRLALARHDVLLRQAIEDKEGVVFKTIGDAFCAAFHTAPNALRAALAAQQALHAEVWPEPVALKVRMALHTGAAEQRDNDYFGPPLNRVARLLSAGNGGQTLLSDVASDLCADDLPEDVTLRSLGTHTLRDLERRENVFQLLHPVLPADFPPLQTLDSLPNNEEPKVYLQEKSPKEVVARINSLNPFERDLVAMQTYVGHWVRWSDTLLGIEPFRFIERGGYTVTVGGGSFVFARLEFLPTEKHLVARLHEGDLISYEAKITHVLDNNIYLTDVTLTPSEERSFVDNMPEDLTRFFEEHTDIQARTRIEGFIGKWMKVSGPLGNVGEFTSFSQVTFVERSSPRATVYMYFRKRKWFEHLSVLNREDTITVLGRIREVRYHELHLDNCELVDPVVRQT